MLVFKENGYKFIFYFFHRIPSKQRNLSAPHSLLLQSLYYLHLNSILQQMGMNTKHSINRGPACLFILFIYTYYYYYYRQHRWRSLMRAIAY